MVPPTPQPDLPPMPAAVPLPEFAPPMSVGILPDDIMALVRDTIEVIEDEVEKETTPVYPKWLKMTGKGKNQHPKAYPRPDPAEALQFVNDQWNLYSTTRARFQDDITFIMGAYTGTVFADAKDDEKENPYKESMVQAEHQFLISMIGNIDPIYEPQVRQRADADEGMNKADFLYAADDEAIMRHVYSGNGPLREDVANTELLYGRIAAQIMYDVDCDEDEIPIRFALIDPATCAPVFEGDRGMSHMCRTYETTLGEAASAFNYDDQFRSKLEAKRSWNKQYANETTCTVKEYWDRWWRIVWVDDILIVGPTAHRLGEPPHIYQLGVMGLPGSANELYVTSDGTQYTAHRSLPMTALPYKGMSFAHLLRQPVRLREALYSRILTQVRRSIDPAYLVMQDHIADDKGVPEIDNGPNKINTALRGHEDITTLPAGPGVNNEFTTIMTAVQDQLGRLMVPAAGYGIGEDGRGGFAMENMVENGRDKFTPHIRTVQMFYTQLAEKRLKLMANWGWMLKQGDNPYGKFAVARPKPMPMQEPQFFITPGDIRRTGTRVKVRMTKPRMQSLSQLTNALAIMNNMGMGNPVYFWEMLGHENPERAALEDRYYRMMQDPAMLQADLIDYLEKNGQQDKAAFIKAQSAGGPALGMMPTDQLSAGASMQEPGGAQAQGMSMPQFNQPPGPVQ